MFVQLWVHGKQLGRWERGTSCCVRSQRKRRSWRKKMEDRVFPLTELEKEALGLGLTNLSVLKSLLIRLYRLMFNLECSRLLVCVFVIWFSSFERMFVSCVQFETFVFWILVLIGFLHMPQEIQFSSSFFWLSETLVHITENVKKTKNSKRRFN